MAKTILEKNVQIRGTITKLFANCPKPSGWFAGMVKTKDLGDICISGTCSNMVSKGVVIECVADLVDGDYGQQYEAQSVSIATDSTGAILAYLSGPSFPHIGRITASKLVNRYGKQVLDLVVNEPQKVMTECNLSENQMKILQTGVANKSIENQLQKKFPHLGATWIRNIVKTSAFGNSYQTIEMAITKNPYCLMNVDGLTFKKADEVATQDLGLKWDDFRRVNCVFDNAMKEFMQSTGGTYVNLMDGSDTYQLRQYLSQHLGVAIDDVFVKNAMMRQVKKNVYYLENYNNEIHLYVKAMKDIETSILEECLYHLQGGSNPKNYKNLSAGRLTLMKAWVQKQKNSGVFDLNTDQENALYTVVENSLSCITGGPGRGKTHLMKVLAEGWKVVTGGGQVLMLAPTGKAVNRIKNETGWLETETIARCVLMNRRKSSKNFACSAITGKETIPLDDTTLILVDEASMIDFEEGEELLRLFHNCQVVLVGDMYQLPPIEPGSFFTEIIQSKVVPVANLRKNMRTKSREISDNADKILSGDTHMIITPNFMMYPCEDAAAVDLAVNSYQNLLANGETPGDIMLMAPINRGVASVSDINRRLQNILNPENNISHHIIDVPRGAQYEDTKGWTIPNVKSNDMSFRIFDRVMNTKNHADYSWKKYKDDDIDAVVIEHGHGLFNGDTGTIIRFYYADDISDSPEIVVKMDDGRVFSIPIEDFHEFVIGYCVTIHKAQGSEAKNVILLLSSFLNNPFFLKSFLNQNLLNTAVTRAKENVMIIGNMDAFKACVLHPYRYHNSVLGTYINYRSIPILSGQNVAPVVKLMKGHVNFPKSWLQHVFTEEEKNDLLAGRSIAVSDCISKKGIKFSCNLMYEDDGTGNYRIMPKFDR